MSRRMLNGMPAYNGNADKCIAPSNKNSVLGPGLLLIIFISLQVDGFNAAPAPLNTGENVCVRCRLQSVFPAT